MPSCHFTPSLILNKYSLPLFFISHFSASHGIIPFSSFSIRESYIKLVLDVPGPLGYVLYGFGSPQSPPSNLRLTSLFFVLLFTFVVSFAFLSPPQPVNKKLIAISIVNTNNILFLDNLFILALLHYYK